MARISIPDIMLHVSNDPIAERLLRAAAAQRSQQIFDDAVIGLRKEFEESKVTQEIDGGIGASNISDTLAGGAAPQNLFSFIGFPAESNPTEAIRARLDPQDPDGPKLTKPVKVQDRLPKYRVTIKSPDLERIYKATPLPWGDGGMSWAEMVESGIPGFAYFLDGYTKSDASRSGGGIEIQSPLRQADYKPPQEGYIGTFVQNFVQRVSNYVKGGLRQRFR